MRTCIWIVFLSGLALQAQDKAIKRVAANPMAPASGAQLFRSYCASCHGADARGNGPAATALKIAPADLTRLAQNNGGKFPNAAVAEMLRDGTQPAHGSAEMPVWGPVLHSVSDKPREMELRINNIVAYLGSVQAK